MSERDGWLRLIGWLFVLVATFCLFMALVAAVMMEPWLWP